MPVSMTHLRDMQWMFVYSNPPLHPLFSSKCCGYDCILVSPVGAVKSYNNKQVSLLSCHMPVKFLQLFICDIFNTQSHIWSTLLMNGPKNRDV